MCSTDMDANNDARKQAFKGRDASVGQDLKRIKTRIREWISVFNEREKGKLLTMYETIADPAKEAKI